VLCFIVLYRNRFLVTCSFRCNNKTETDILLRALICESSRLHPAEQLSFPEITTNTSTYAGYVLPHGTNIMIDCVSYNKHPSLWNDANVFDVNRWNNNKTSSYHRFGLGLRRCMGYRLAGEMISQTLIEAISICDRLDVDCIDNTINTNFYAMLAQKRPGCSVVFINDT